uniref:Uncharacterized protein n=1 Tax=Anguilla anguilla TaxID=7936 RepID=A0A0E9U285_ANGAN
MVQNLQPKVFSFSSTSMGDIFIFYSPSRNLLKTGLLHSRLLALLPLVATGKHSLVKKNR